MVYSQGTVNITKWLIPHHTVPRCGKISSTTCFELIASFSGTDMWSWKHQAPF